MKYRFIYKRNLSTSIFHDGYCRRVSNNAVSREERKKEKNRGRKKRKKKVTGGRKIVNSQGTSVKVQLCEDTMERRLIIKIFFIFVSCNFLIVFTETDFSVQAPSIDGQRRKISTNIPKKIVSKCS